MIGQEGAPRPGVDVMAQVFDSSRRTGRIGFLVKISTLIEILAIYDRVARGELRALTGWLVEWPLFFSGACVLSQRLHDRGRAGWWGAPILLAFCLAWPYPQGAFGIAALAVAGASGLWLGVMPGEASFNRYGPRP